MGNYSKKYQAHYNCKEHRDWSKQVMMRDDYLCQNCKAKGVIRQAREAHHIKPIETHWDKRFDLDNGIALCRTCHNDEHDRRSELSKFMEDWE